MRAREKFQKRALNATVKHFKKHDRGQIRWACGVGKTKLSADVYHALNCNLAVVIAPSRDLLLQLVDEWRAWGLSAEELIVAHVYKGAKATGDSRKIRKFLNDDPGKKIVFTTYRSLEKVGEAARRCKKAFDLAIFDEAHRTAGDSSKTYGLGLSGRTLPARKRLFLTATPRIYVGNIGETKLVNSMDDEAVYGKILDEVSFAEAIEKNVLTPVRLIVATSKYDAARKTDKDGIAEKSLCVLKAIKKHNLKKGISFHSRVKRSLLFAAATKNAAKHVKIDIDAIFADSNLSPTSRQQYRDALLTNRTQKVLVSNCKLYKEGVDVPNLDYVAIVDPKSSETDLVQIIGRVIRKQGRKKLGYLVVPVTLDENDEVTNADIKHIRKIVDAVAMHNEVLCASIQEEQSPTGVSRRKKRETLQDQLAALISVECEKDIAERIFSQVTTRLYKPNRIAELEEMVESDEWPPTSSPLGNWMKDQVFHKRSHAAKIESLFEELVKKQGLTHVGDLATELDVQRFTIDAYIRRKSIVVKKYRGQIYLPKESANQVEGYFKPDGFDGGFDGFLTTREVADRFGRSIHMVRDIARRHSVTTKKRGKQNYLKLDEIEEALSLHAPVKKLSRGLVRQIKQIVKKPKSEWSRKELAEKFEIPVHQINSIIAGITYKSV